MIQCQPVTLFVLYLLFYFQTEEFCTHYGFGINEEYILFNSTSYMNPDESYPRKKCGIIQDKCILTLSEVHNLISFLLIYDKWK